MSAYLDICTAIGFIVLLGMWLALAWFLTGICIDGWRDRRKVYVPRDWVSESREDRARRGTAGRGRSRHGTAVKVPAWHDVARHGSARHGSARQGTTHDR